MYLNVKPHTFIVSKLKGFWQEAAWWLSGPHAHAHARILRHPNFAVERWVNDHANWENQTVIVEDPTVVVDPWLEDARHKLIADQQQGTCRKWQCKDWAGPRQINGGRGSARWRCMSFIHRGLATRRVPVRWWWGGGWVDGEVANMWILRKSQGTTWWGAKGGKWSKNQS